jgi:cytochrome c peroxidase
LEPIRPVPADNPLTVAKVQLGRRLFFDPVLSADRTISCASCHDPARGLADAERTSQGIGGKRGSRNAPSLFNVAYGRSFFWDGRVLSLEEQATRPIESPQEMGNTLDEVIARLKGDPWYRDEFARAFPDGVTGTNLARAIASFQRVLLLGASKEDAFVYGDAAALDDRERHGKWLFESKGRCWRCHSGRNFSDGAFHNTGVSWNAVLPDRGRYHVTGEDRDAGRFKTPSLRGVAGTAPYMHDGSISTLQEAVEFYDRGGGKNPNLDPILTPLDLSTDEVRSLVAFLKALSVSRQESDRGK